MRMRAAPAHFRDGAAHMVNAGLTSRQILPGGRRNIAGRRTGGAPVFRRNRLILEPSPRRHGLRMAGVGLGQCIL
jgi:hypothetical protein